MEEVYSLSEFCTGFDRKGEEMKNKKTIFVALVICTLCLTVIWSCGKDDIPVIPPHIFGDAIELQPYDLPSLNANICYELWLVDIDHTYDADSNEVRIINEEMSLGRFYWDNARYEFSDLNGNVISNIFHTVDARNVYDFNTLMITFEAVEDDGIRANNGLIYADIEFGQPVHGIFNFFGTASPDVVMELEDPDENRMTADYVLRTHSDDGNPDTDIASGIWFHSFVQGQTGQVFAQTLLLPPFTESANFTYEGWVKMPGSLPRPISTGKFKVPYFEDWSNPHTGSYAYLGIPGEDFLINPPDGFEGLFPLVLIGDGTDTVFITIEPYPDPDPLDPFPLRIFDEGELPADSSFLTRTFHMRNMYGLLPSFDAEVLEL
jgi:hypothetical protein